MPNEDKTETKVQRPHAAFDAPHEVVADPSLSKQEKVAALDALEQDARQLATASAEGMTGGEPVQLSEVLQAREALEMPPMAFAYDLVLKDLETRRDGPDGPVTRAITALHAVLPAH